MTTGPKCRIYSLDEAAQMQTYLSREARRRRTEPGSANIDPPRRKQLLARAEEIAADIKARP